VIPDILSAQKKDETVRVWSVGCASGEETYTIAMLLAEAMGLENFSTRIKIYPPTWIRTCAARLFSAGTMSFMMRPFHASTC
jgi:hypothetical protein